MPFEFFIYAGLAILFSYLFLKWIFSILKYRRKSRFKKGRSHNISARDYPDIQEWKHEGVLHREDGPAVIWRRKDTGEERKEWWVNGKRHRIDGSAVEYSDGRKEWWVNGERHRDDGPAVEDTHGYQTWWQHGKLHRENGPAKITPSKSIGNFWGVQKWFIDGKLHRENGPAVEVADGTTKWYRHGRMHRENGPAIERPSKDQLWWINQEWWVNGRRHREGAPAIEGKASNYWYFNGKLHREDGPAVEHRYGEAEAEITREWWMHGIRHREAGPAVEVGAVPVNELQRAKEAQEKYGSNNSPITHMRFTYYGTKDFQHRERYYGDREWWVIGKLHREGAPAVERLDGTKKWLQLGRLHREDGPAAEYPAGSKEWWQHGKLHREDGPAVDVAERHAVLNMNDVKQPSGNLNIHYRIWAQEWLAEPPKFKGARIQTHTGKEWWLKGKQFSEEEWMKRAKNLSSKKSGEKISK